MSDYNGFWSYVRKDDEADGGRIHQLCMDLTEQYEMLTGEQIRVFLDRDAIEWGQHWRERVDQGLTCVVFLVAILSPRYFQSPECRRELQQFARTADRLGIKDLVLPILYVDVADIHEDQPADELVRLVRDFQWEDWRERRFADRSASSYRRAISKLAKRLVDANRKAEPELVAAEAAGLDRLEVIEDDRRPGVVEIVAEAEVAIPKWEGTLESIGDELEFLAIAVSASASAIRRLEAAGSGFTARERVLRRLAAQLSESTQRLRALSAAYAAELYTVDKEISTLLAMARSAAQHDRGAVSYVCEIFSLVKKLSTNLHTFLDAMQVIVDEVGPLEEMSRALRPQLRTLKRSLTNLIEARWIMDGWVSAIDAGRVPCPEADAENYDQ